MAAGQCATAICEDTIDPLDELKLKMFAGQGVKKRLGLARKRNVDNFLFTYPSGAAFIHRNDLTTRPQILGTVRFRRFRNRCLK